MRHPRTWTQDKITTLTYTYLEEPSPGQQNRLTLSPLILASIHGSCLEQWLLRYSHGDFLFQLLPPYMHYLKLLCKGDLPLLCHLLICISVDNHQVRTYCCPLLCCSDCSNSDHLGVLSRWCLCSSDIFLLFVCFTSSLWSRLHLAFPLSQCIRCFKFWLFLFRNSYLDCRWASCYWGITISRPSQWTELGNIFQNTNPCKGLPWWLRR